MQEPAVDLTTAVTDAGPASLRSPSPRAVRAVLTAVGALAAVAVVTSSIDRFHWWANFVLIPGAALVATTAAVPRAPRAARFALGWIGVVILGTGVLLLTGTMDDYWPIMIILPCFGPLALFGWRPTGRSVLALTHTVAGLAAVATALGGWFLVLRDGTVDVGGARWWVVFMVAAGGVPISTGLLLMRARRGTYWFSTAVLLIALGVMTLAVALREYRR